MVLQNLGYTALLLGVLVVVHEFGHFLLAKWMGVKVLRFSVGFGPRILGFTRGETEYRLSAVPLGGYVKMAGDVPGEELSPEDASRGFLAQPPWRRVLIVAAGPVFNLLFPVLVYLAVFASYPQASTRIMSVEPGLPAARAGIQIGDRVLAVGGHRVGSFEELRHRMEGVYARPVTLELERDGRTFRATLTPVPTSDETPLRRSTRGLIGISPYAEPLVIGVPPGSAAARVGLKSFDQIVALDGTPVKDALALKRRLSEDAANPVTVSVLRFNPLPLPGTAAALPTVLKVSLPRGPGDGVSALGLDPADTYVGGVAPGSAAASAGIAPGDKLVSLDGQPVPSMQLLAIQLEALGDRPFTLTFQHGGELKTARLARPAEPKRPLLGIQPYSAPEPTIDKAKVPFRTAVATSLWRVRDDIQEAVAGFALWVVHKVPFDSVGGPIMIYQLASKSAQAGPEYFLHLMALISVSLGVMNLLPIPILDGFHLVAAFWEGVRKRPIPTRAREIANLVGLAMLIALMVVAFTNDLTR